MSNRVVHFVIPCDDPEKNMKFFSEAFGWTFEQFGNEPYWSVTTGDDSKPGINGGLMKKRDPQQPVANSIEVRDIDRAIAHVTAAGGTIVVEKMAVPSIGWMAYFKDPDGNIHGLFQEDHSAVYEPGVQAS